MRHSSILITSTSSGISKTLTLEFANMGYKVVAAVRSDEDAQKLKGHSKETIIFRGNK